MIAEKTTMIDVTMNKDVLVVGCGTPGVDAAAALSEKGYTVVLAHDSDQPMAVAGVEVMAATQVASLAGVAGDYRTCLATADRSIERTFGAVVVAPVYGLEPLNLAYDLTLDKRVVTMTQMEALLEDAAFIDGLKKGEGKSVAFVSGFGQEGDPAATRRVLVAALAIQKLGNSSAYIYANNVKVGGPGLERLFTEGRHQGVVCFKPTEKPVIDQGETLKITINDPVIREDVILEPDYIVVEEKTVVGRKNLDLAATLRIDTDCDGLLPSNNVHRFPVRSNREGIFVASQPVDSANVVLRVDELLKAGVVTVAKERAVVDDTKCVICLTCYRCCPHGAIFWENGVAAISPVACQGCGICASECPMDAIQIGGFTDNALKADIEAAVTSVKGTPSIVAFCCENSAFEAGQAAKALGVDLPDGFRMVQVPCAGKVDVEFIMKAFVEGADGVMVAACHEGNCKAERGNTYAGWRVAEVQKRLEAMGLNKDRLIFTTIASNMAEEFSAKVRKFAEKL
ncbi:putative fusion protein, heterodisulfide reductase (HdrA) / F420-non-reducing hydrogenase (MvhD) [Desulforapulum autotrophicum HRM2]|uniref:Fusion protein, heterodisulfide reductase (HdrA) / F420-non-reducing hydrogenase (MvhD) n=1 Tax=Desulforapulum autotrophicum (strain ATCC 43914 / DSM 3382 / VKM B-1955 / HRM2) TaxID=177437 RepID=C0QKS0_DESAH|nr:hydrogenase iron-sulfur subunit [Desulforapulum autotrophicum]ACN16160.1 putative fusion protein, heterodisulfide reductase (HdrA) / F420-non-reducing hydrogenase (MvhD) [Desulforapulum autotrophicum HRM2]